MATHSGTFSTALRAAASDFSAGGAELSVDWMRMSPYPASGTFDSRVLDAGQSVNWDALSWTADTPAGTGVALSVRTGNTPTPDGSWSGFNPVGSSGGSIGGNSRYLQYRVQLSSSDQGKTPTLSDVSASYAADTTAPDTQIDTGPSGTSSDPSPAFSFSADESGSSFECRLDSSDPGDWASCSSPKPYTNLADGSHTFEVRATDGAGNTDQTPASRTWTIDTGAPDTQIDTGPSGTSSDPSPAFSFSADESGSSFECRLDSSDPGDWASCSSPKPYTNLADGSHTFEVRATDGAGNTDQTPASRTWTIDTVVPPAPLITDTDPKSPANNNNPRIKGTAEPDSTVKLYTAGGCTGTPVASGPASDFASPGLAVTVEDDTTTRFRATATDGAGNASPCSPGRNYVEDSTPPPAPEITGTDPESPANKNHPRIKGTAEADSTVKLYTTADCTGAPVTSGSASKFASPGIVVAVGGNTTTPFRATATDRAGNASPCSVERTYVEDSIRPQTTITSGPSGKTTDDTPTFAFQSSESGSTFVCRFDSEPFDSCSGPGASHTPSGPLSLGAHTFEVQATDQARNTDPTPAKRKFTVTQ